MRRYSRLLAVAAVMLVMAIVLTACSSKPAEETPAETKTPVELVVWSHLMENEVKEVEKVANEWAAQTGNKVTVLWDQSDFQAFATAAQSGQAPDIMFGIGHDNLGTFWKAGLLEAVPDGTIDKSKYTESVIPALTWDGKMYGVPVAMETYGLFYRTDKLDKAPETYADFIKAAQDKGFAYDINNFYYSYAFLSGNGGYIYKDTGAGLDPKDIGVATPGAIKGWQLISDFVNKYKFMPGDINGDTAKGLFQKGDTSMYISGPWDVQGLKDANVPFAVAPLPKLEGGEVARPFMGVQAAFVASASKHKAEAWDLMKYLLDKTPMPLVDVGHRIPVRKADLADAKVANDPVMKAFAASAANANPMPNVPEVQAMWTPGANALKQITQQNVAADKAAADCKTEIEKQIAAMGQ